MFVHYREFDAYRLITQKRKPLTPFVIKLTTLNNGCYTASIQTRSKLPESLQEAFSLSSGTQ